MSELLQSCSNHPSPSPDVLLVISVMSRIRLIVSTYPALGFVISTFDSRASASAFQLGKKRSHLAFLPARSLQSMARDYLTLLVEDAELASFLCWKVEQRTGGRANWDD